MTEGLARERKESEKKRNSLRAKINARQEREQQRALSVDETISLGKIKHQGGGWPKQIMKKKIRTAEGPSGARARRHAYRERKKKKRYVVGCVTISRNGTKISSEGQKKKRGNRGLAAKRGNSPPAPRKENQKGWPHKGATTRGKPAGILIQAARKKTELDKVG